ncbi:MAG: serine/threonine-protein kinase [Myxococcota bacterium]
MALEIGQLAERYVVEALLGEGGLATVYRVRHRTLNTVYALKVLNVDSASVRKRLIQEGQVQATLKHPHIVEVRDVLDLDGVPGLLMEYVDGVSMEDWLRAHRPTTEEALCVFRGVVAGVAHAHQHGLIHRDLKPANVMLEVSTDQLIPKVADFGLAKMVEVGSGHTRTGTTMGTPAYMPPEQIRDASSVDRRADLYSLGIVLYELFCGCTPFDDDDLLELFAKVRDGSFTPPSELNPDVPIEVERCIGLLVDTQPANRLSDCQAILTVLDGGEAEVSGTALVPSRPLVLRGAHSLGLESPGGRVAARLSVEKRQAVTPLGPLVDGGPGSLRSVPEPTAETMGASFLAEDVEGRRSADGAPEVPATTGSVAPTMLPEPVPAAPVEVPRAGVPVWAMLAMAGVFLVAVLAVSVPAALWALAVLRTPAPDPVQIVVPVPPPVAPEPVAEPVPAPEPTPAPAAPEPAPVVEPAPAAPAPAKVRPTTGQLTADGVRSAWVEVDGQRFRPGDPIPAGEWPLFATFDGAPTAVRVRTVLIVAGQTTALSCNARYRRCDVEVP